MEGAWPREAKGSVCPDSCCSFVTCPGSGRRRRKEALGVTAEGSLSPPGAGCWHPATPRTGIPGSAHPGGHRPSAHGSRGWLPRGQTHLCGRHPAVLALHGEALGRKEGTSVGGQVGTPASGHPPGQGGHPEPTSHPSPAKAGSPGTPCPRGDRGPLPGWQRAGWCPGRGQGGRGWWPPSEATGEGGKEVEGMRDEVECPCGPLDPL